MRARWFFIGMATELVAVRLWDRMLREIWSDYRWFATRRDDVINLRYDAWLSRTLDRLMRRTGRRWTPGMEHISKAEADKYMERLGKGPL